MKITFIFLFIFVHCIGFSQLASWNNGSFKETDELSANNMKLWNEGNQHNYEEVSRNQNAIGVVEVILNDLNGRSMQVRLTNTSSYWKFPNDTSWTVLYNGSWSVKPTFNATPVVNNPAPVSNPIVNSTNSSEYRFSESILQINNAKKLSKKDQNALLTKVLDSLYITLQKERVFNNQKNNELNKQIAALDDKARKMGGKLNSKNDKIKEGETKLTDLALENITLQTKVESLNNELKVAQDKLGDANGQLMSKNQQINSLENQLKTAQDNSSKLADQTNLNQEITNLKRLLQEKTDSLKLLRTTTNKPSINANQNNGTSATKVTNNTSHTAITSQTGSFKSVKIGTQTWMAENLNVDRFRNGDPIPEAKTAEEWEKSIQNKQPAYAYSFLDPEKKHGKYYNWYAANDSRELVPKGWHIPSETEFEILVNFLGGTEVAGKKMKSISGGWDDVPIQCKHCSHYTENQRDYNICPVCNNLRVTGYNSGNGDNSSGFNAFNLATKPFACYYKGVRSSFWGLNSVKQQVVCVLMCDHVVVVSGDNVVEGAPSMIIRCIKD